MHTGIIAASEPIGPGPEALGLWALDPMAHWAHGYKVHRPWAYEPIASKPEALMHTSGRAYAAAAVHYMPV